MSKNDNLRRRKPTRNPKLRFLIVCEGEVTEPHYFRQLRHLMRSLIELELSPGGDPKAIVERAVATRNQANAAAARQKDSFVAYDQVWCVFDVDQHERLGEALQQARDNKVSVAVSNPCFELWALLHFQDQTAHTERTRIQSLCRKYMPGYDKELPCAKLMQNCSQAMERAASLDQWHETRETLGGNPSTGVYLLIKQIESKA